MRGRGDKRGQGEQAQAQAVNRRRGVRRGGGERG